MWFFEYSVKECIRSAQTVAGTYKGLMPVSHFWYPGFTEENQRLELLSNLQGMVTCKMCLTWASNPKIQFHSPCS